MTDKKYTKLLAGGNSSFSELLPFPENGIIITEDTPDWPRSDQKKGTPEKHAHTSRRISGGGPESEI